MLEGKVALVTGAAQNLGRGYAELLAARGAAVAVADINAEGAAAVAEVIRATGATAFAVGMDVASEPSVAAGFAAAQAELGEVSILVNNAGGVMVPPKSAEGYGVEEWNRVLAVNLTGAWLCCRAVIPQMKAAGYGRIINVTSTTVDYGLPTELVPYISAKAGLIGLTRSLARELGPHNVTVNAVAPGLVPPKSTAGRSINDGKLQSIVDLVVRQQCIARPGQVDDLPGAVAFLASDEARFISGQVLNVDGGWAFG